MKIKKIQLHLVILFMLAIGSFAFYINAQETASTDKNIFLDSDQDGLSDAEEKTYGTNPQKADSDGDSYSDGAEIRSGYDPLKPSPGDKLIPNTNTSSATKENATTNLTNTMAQKISAVVENSDSENKEVSLDQVKSIVSESLNTQVSDNEFPEVSKDDIKIKKQNFKGMSEEKIAKKKKEDFSDYIVGLFYIMSVNSSEPLTSISGINSIVQSISSDVSSAISSRNPKDLEEMIANEQKIIDQLKDLPVPEDVVDLHIKSLRIAKHTQTLKDSISVHPEDPVFDLANLSKLYGFISYLSSFSNDISAKINEYGLTYDDSMKKKLDSYGISLSKDSLDQILSQTTTATTTELLTTTTDESLQ